MSVENNKTLWGKMSDKAKEAYAFLKTEVESLKIEMAETPAPVKMGETTLQDGTVVKYTGDTLAVGSDITLVTPQGEIPAPDGELVLADGTNVTVVSGKATEVEAASAETTEPEMSEDKKVSERITKIVEKFEASEKALEAKFKAQEIQIENLKLKLAKVAGSVIKNTEMLIEFGATPTADAIETPSFEGMSKKEKLAHSLTK